MTDVFKSIGLSNRSTWAGLRVVAVDIDGTLTMRGRFPAEVVASLYTLQSRGIKVCLVTGRPSGWVQGLATYLPVDAAIAENGGVIFLGAETQPLIRDAQTGNYVAIGDEQSRGSLRQMYSQLNSARPQLRVTEDNHYRLSDFTFHVNGLGTEALSALKSQVEQAGLAFTWSTIHAHIMPCGQEKGAALEWLLERWGIESRPATTTLTIGDSPNDASLFCADKFPLSAGVANIVKYRDLMEHYPRIISTMAEADGFVEIVNTLLKIKSEHL
ncbi:MAG: hypothetical protein RLZZ488_1677 [Pseudomonadota bacterium]|jgi:HAD superfamily hydrolase (TIGR01484 family)